MAAIAQRWRGKTPVAVRAHQRGAEQRLTIVNADHSARFTAAAQGWRVIIAARSVWYRRGAAAAVLGQGHVRGHCRWLRIDSEINRAGGRTGVAGSIGDGNRQAVLPFTQSGCREAPAAIGTDGDRTQQRGAVVNTDNGPRFGRAAQRRRVVIGAGAARDSALHAARVIRDQQIADRRWCRGITAAAIVAAAVITTAAATTAVVTGDQRTDTGQRGAGDTKGGQCSVTRDVFR